MSAIFTLKYYIYALLFNFVCCSTVTLLILSIKRDSNVIKLFAMFTGEIAIWALFYWISLITEDAFVSEIFFRACMIPVVVIPASFFHFIVELIKVRVSRKIHYANYSLSLFLLLTIYTPLFAVSTTKPVFVFLHWPEPGPLFPIHLVHFVGIAIVAHIMMFNVKKRAESLVFKRQVLVVFWGTIVAFSAGTTNYLTWYRISPPLPNPTISFYAVAVLYAVFKHQLMGIDVIIKRTLKFAGLVTAVVAVVSLVAFISQDVLANFVTIPKWLSNVIAAAIIAFLYEPIRNLLTNVTEKYLFQKKYDYRELLKKFTEEVGMVLDLKQVAQMTVNTFADTVKLEGAALLLLSKESESRKYELVASKGNVGGKTILDEQDPFVVFIRETHEPIGQDGELGKVQFPPEVRNRLKELNARLCLPLHVHEDLIGVLCLGKKKSDEEFAKDDLDILIPLSRTLAIAVSNAKLVEENTQAMALASFREKQAMIGTLSAGINHEICNPLGIVKAQCEAYLLDSEDGILVGKSQQEILERTSNIMRVALKQIDRATMVTQTLSNFAKPIKEVKAQPVNIAAEVDEVLLLVGHDLKLDKIEVIREIAEDVPKIAVDRRQLQQVLFNLIRNAGQAIAPPGKIWVRAHADGERVKIEIADTGAGIAPDKLDKIGNPFFTTKEPGKGTGLGLFITRQLIESNKGRMHVESVVGKGTTFILDFPIAKEEALAAGAAK